MLYDQVKYLDSVNGIHLNLTDRTLYSELLNNAPFYIRERGYYAPATASLSDLVGISVSQIKRTMKKLIQCGLVIVLNHKANFPNEIAVVRLDDTVIKPDKNFDERQQDIKSKAITGRRPMRTPQPVEIENKTNNDINTEWYNEL